MEGEGRRRDAEGVGQGAGRRTLGTGAHEQPEHLQAGLLGEGREGGYGVLLFHDSNVMET